MTIVLESNMIQGILQNKFIVSIVLPVALAFISALLERRAESVHGESEGDYKYLVWKTEQVASGSTVIKPVPRQSLAEIFDLKRFPKNSIIDIEPMPGFEISQIPTLGINLVMASFVIDITSLIGNKGSTGSTSTTVLDTTNIGWVIFGHLVLLIGTLEFVRSSKSAGPTDMTRKENAARNALLLGVFAMITAFLAL